MILNINSQVKVSIWVGKDSIEVLKKWISSKRDSVNLHIYTFELLFYLSLLVQSIWKYLKNCLFEIHVPF